MTFIQCAREAKLYFVLFNKTTDLKKDLIITCHPFINIKLPGRFDNNMLSIHQHQVNRKVS